MGKALLDTLYVELNHIKNIFQLELHEATKKMHNAAAPSQKPQEDLGPQKKQLEEQRKQVEEYKKQVDEQKKATDGKQRQIEQKEKELAELDKQLRKRKEQMDQLEISLQKVIIAQY